MQTESQTEFYRRRVSGIGKTDVCYRAHLTASNKGELANQNVAYKIFALELLIYVQLAVFSLIQKRHHCR